MIVTTPIIHILDIDHIQLDVANIEESYEFYNRVFGFEIKEVGIRAVSYTHLTLPTKRIV